MEHQCASSVLTADGNDIIQCARPDTHAGQHRNWQKDKTVILFQVEWKTGEEVPTTSIRVAEVDPAVLAQSGAEFAKDLPEGSIDMAGAEILTAEQIDEVLKEAIKAESLEPTDVMVPVAAYDAMVDALERIAKGADRWQSPQEIAKEALEAVNVKE